MANPDRKDTADYQQDKIFVGWNIGGKDQFQNLVRKYRNKPNIDHRKAIRIALRRFPDVVGNRRGRIYLDRSEFGTAFYGGEPGSGKSFNLRGLSNRSTVAGVNNVLIDAENEYFTNNLYDGIQKDLMNLRPEEHRQNVRTKILTPYFIRKARREQDLPEHGAREDWHDVFKFEFTDLTPADIEFMLISKFEWHPDFQNFAGVLERRLRSGASTIKQWSDIVDVAYEMQAEEQFEYRRRAGQIERFIKNNYKKWGFLGTDRRINLAEIFEDYSCVALNLHDDEYLSDDLRMKELYVAFLIKRVRNLVQRGLVSKPVNFVIDEAHHYIPADTDEKFPPSKKEVRWISKQGRKRGFRLTMASQEPADIQDKNFLNLTRYYFIPQNMKPQPRRHLLSMAGVYQQGDRGYGKWKRITDALDEYQWLFVDAEQGWWCALEPASPLANHFQEG